MVRRGMVRAAARSDASPGLALRGAGFAPGTRRRAAGLRTGLLLGVLAPALVFADPLDCWTNRYQHGSDVFNVANLGGLWVALGRDAVLTSTNGLDWNSRYLGTGTDELELFASALGNGRFLAIGGQSIIGSTRSGPISLATSTDGVTWTRGNAGAGSELYSVAFGNGTFVAVGETLSFGGANQMSIVTSTTGTNWIDRSPGLAGGLLRVIFAEGRFVAVGRQGVMLTSASGVQWIAHPSGTTEDLSGIAYGNGLYVAAGASGSLLLSSNGTAWQLRASGYDNLNAITYGAGRFVLAPNVYGLLLSSTNGMDWRRHSSAVGAALSVAFGDGTFMGVDFSRQIWQSASWLAGAPPGIAVEPQDQTVYSGLPASLSVSHAGCSVPTFQWSKDGVPIPGATSSTLNIDAASGSDTGNYSVILDDTFGSSTSRLARLEVVPAPVQLSRRGSWPGYERGPAYDVTVVSNRAYVAMGSSGFGIFDVSDPSRPVHLGAGATRRSAEGIEVTDDFAFVLERAQNPGAFEIFDVRNPSAPKRTGGYEAKSSAFALQVVGHYAYLGTSTAAEDTGALDIIDVSDPAQPVRVGYGGRTAAVDLRVSGSYVYTAALSDGLRVFDVSTPAHPVEAGAVGLDGSAIGIAVADSYAYVTVRGSAGSNTLEIVDVSETATPRRVGRYHATGDTRDVQVVGHYAYLVSLKWTGSRYVGDLQIVDVGAPAHPVLVGTLQLEDYGSSGANGHLVVVGSYVYVASVGSWQLIDVSDVAHPARVTGGGRDGFAQAVRVVGHYAYLADSFAGLQVIDVSNPDRPVRVGGLQTGGFAQDVEVVGDLAYVADHFQGLQVISVRDPANPVRVGGYDTDGCAESPHALRVVGHFAYLAGGTPDLQVIDLSDPANPSPVGGYPTAYAKGVEVVGDRAYVAGGREVGEDRVGFLQVFDLVGATNPVPIGFTDTASYGYGVAVTGSNAYVVGEDAALTVVNVSNPTNPLPVASYSTTGWAQAVQVVGQYAFLAGEYTGLLALDVSDPANPVRVAQYPLGTGEDQGWDIQVVGNHAYLARGPSGLLVFEIAGPPIRSILREGLELVLRWDAAPGRRLQRSSSPNPGIWTDVPETEGRGSIRLSVGSEAGFFRLTTP